MCPDVVTPKIKISWCDKEESNSSLANVLIWTCMEMEIFVSFCSIFFTLGQNESGVAVHNERIYLVGGYSIWTNEPLACIQVSGGSSY